MTSSSMLPPFFFSGSEAIYCLFKRSAQFMKKSLKILSSISEDPSNKARLLECLEGVLNKAQDAPKSKKVRWCFYLLVAHVATRNCWILQVQHSNAKNAVLFEAIALIIHMDSEANLLVRACNQLGTFLAHRETNLRYVFLYFSIRPIFDSNSSLLQIFGVRVDVFTGDIWILARDCKETPGDHNQQPENREVWFFSVNRSNCSSSLLV